MSDDENPYVLLTPGPLSTSKSVKRVMLRDWCTWDDDYNVGVVQVIRRKLVELAVADPAARPLYTSVLMQGSGTFSVESVLGSVIPEEGKLMVLANGAYGQRIAKIAQRLKIAHEIQDSGETKRPDARALRQRLMEDPSITHVAMVHGETTTGMLNPIAEIAQVVKEARRVMIVDAMSTFGGIPLDVEQLGIDYLISSANKCIQGVPGFGLIVARREAIESCDGYARSLSLDLLEQWRAMESGHGKWRYTSPTHTVRAFAQALEELDVEGGVEVRHQRYLANHSYLVQGMQALGFRCLLPAEFQSPIITAFYEPEHSDYRFQEFYDHLKSKGFVIYPGKVTDVDTFRIGTIGEVYPETIERLLKAVEASLYWKG